MYCKTDLYDLCYYRISTVFRFVLRLHHHQTQHNVILGLQRGKLLAVFTPKDARGRKTRAEKREFTIKILCARLI